MTTPHGPAPRGRPSATTPTATSTLTATGTLTPAGTLTPTSTLSLHRLTTRRDGADWLVGRLDTGEVVALPDTGEQALRLLGQGRTLAETERALTTGTGRRPDLTGFVHALLDLGFVRELDGRPVRGPAPPRPTLPRLRPRHVRWVLSPAVPALLGALTVAAAAAVLFGPRPLPGYRDLLWSPHGSLVLGSALLVSWLLVLLHEAGHLVAARATGVPARIRFGTRLQFLVLQTDLSGIELAPRRHRLTAYLAGIAVNLAVASVALLLAASLPAGGPARPLSALALLSLLQIPFQAMVFLRTDLYFVLQDLTRCRDLHGDGAAYAHHLARLAGHRLRRRSGPRPADPSRGLPAGERRVVRAYSAVLALGGASALAGLLRVTLPADLTLLARAVAGLGAGRPLTGRLDSAVVLLVLGGTQVLWLLTRRRERRRRRSATSG
ncbi:hypothetical protein [Kitasatospora herbaricolor]|uniref:Peptide zinc metalloprotease protein n=1 Tax=Kitasatospora herbaricolor TaxID=68217 RepID=A0ABZ1WDL7_9ACTN|nr:hypothetical protein [Kitasatospora herbaricolor]